MIARIHQRLGCLAATLAAVAVMTAAGAGEIEDPPNLCEMRKITSGPYEYTHAYPTARTWSQDHRSVFVESGGPGPDGVVKKNVRHLLAIDADTRQVKYLATVEHPDPEKPAGWMMFDFAPQANCVVYVGPESKTIHLLNLDTMKSGLIFEEPEGTIQGPLTIAWDATRVVWWTMMPSIPNRFFDDYITVIFAIDVDPVDCKAVGEPRIVEAYPRRKGPTWTKEKTRDGIHVNHPQINPRSKDHICFSHEMLGSEPDGTVARSRLWQSMVNEDGKTYLIRQPAGLHFTHEVIAPDGRSLIFPYMHGVGQVFFDTFEKRSIYYNPNCCPGHLTITPDGKWIVGDTWGRRPGKGGRELQSIMMFDVATRRFANLCWFNFSHPHPIFSQDGRRIAFSYFDDDKHQQVAVIDVTQVQKDWDRLHEGTGELEAPAWKDTGSPGPPYVRRK